MQEAEDSLEEGRNSLPVFPDLNKRVAVVTGAGGAIGGAIAAALAYQGVRVAIWDLSSEAAQRCATNIANTGGSAVPVTCDVTSRADVIRAMDETKAVFGPVDILINGAGGSRKDVTTSPELSFFDISDEALVGAFALNYQGTVLPTQIVARGFAEQGSGVILNIASIAGVKPLTRAVGYSNAKAAVVSFTEWLAVHMAQNFSPRIRVNALAPGFVLTDQNRFLLQDKQSGQPTERCRAIIDHVPMSRLGEPQDMIGAVLWLVSDSASFVTGTTIAVDGGLTAWHGV